VLWKIHVKAEVDGIPMEDRRGISQSFPASSVLIQVNKFLKRVEAESIVQGKPISAGILVMLDERKENLIVSIPEN
jgi:hypothetical protein